MKNSHLSLIDDSVFCRDLSADLNAKLTPLIASLKADFSIEVCAEIDSTNTELMRRARNGVYTPVLLMAQRQTAGRGRLGRVWQSAQQPQHALTFSLGLLLNPSDWSGLSLAIGLALAQNLHPAIQLKWPNDLWLFERKLGGILVETSPVVDAAKAGLRYAVIGVGINLSATFAQTMPFPAAGLSEVLPQLQANTLDARAQILQQLLPPLMLAVLEFERSGFAPLQAAFNARDALHQRPVRLSTGAVGCAQGVDPRGALLLQTEHGLMPVISAEVSVRPT